MEHGNNRIINRILTIFLCLVLAMGICGCNGVNKSDVTEDLEKNELLNTEIERGELKLDSSFLTGDVAEIVERGKLIVGMQEIKEASLFSSKSDGVYDGIDIYYAGILAEGLGVELVIDDSYQNFEELIKALLDDEIDLIISGMSITNDRAKYINYSDPYLSGKMALMCDKSVLVENDALENPIAYIEDNDVVIGVYGDAYYANVIESRFPNAKIVFSDSRDELVRLVADGKIFAYVENDDMFIYYYAKYPEHTLHTQIYIIDEYTDEIGIGVNPANVSLLNYVNVCLNSSKLTKDDIDELCRDSFEFY